MTIAVVIVWYGLGLGTAAVMARRGHDPMPWIFLGWLGGAWSVLVALGYEHHLRRRGSQRDPSVVDVRRPAPRPGRPLEA